MLQWLTPEFGKSLIIAIILVLLARFFCLEPFKIPTSSMEPTLIGDPACGDQIVVNKFGYALHRPQRWEIMVLRYPFDLRRYFIKRLIGLPGEEVFIKNGNIYINGRIARKPLPIQQALHYPVFTKIHGREQYQNAWNPTGVGWQWLDNGFILQSEELGWCRYDQEITNKYAPLQDRFFLKRSRPPRTVGGMHTVGELCLECTLQAQSEQGTAVMRIRKGPDKFQVNLVPESDGLTKSPDMQPVSSVTTSSLLWYHGENDLLQQTIPISFRLKSGQTYRVRFSNIDDLVTLTIDGNSLATLDYALPLAEAANNTYESGVQLGGKNGRFSFTNIDLWRDIYYLSKKDIFNVDQPWKVPPEHYFVLGDNSPDSNDSREWKCFRLTLQNGLYLEGDQQFAPVRRQDHYHFTDICGQARVIPCSATREIKYAIEAPFVPAHYVVGRAFAVFWPPTRMKIIR